MKAIRKTLAAGSRWRALAPIALAARRFLNGWWYAAAVVVAALIMAFVDVTIAGSAPVSLGGWFFLWRIATRTDRSATSQSLEATA